MKLKSLDSNKNITMIEVAKAVLEENEDVMHFDDILNEVSNFLDFSDQEIEDNMTLFYADLNTEGSFISVGNNTWGLRRWYPIDSINEAVTVKNEEKDLNPHIAPDGFVELFEEDEAEEEPLITKANIDEDFDSIEDEEEDPSEEIQEYEDELSELGVENDEEDDEDFVE